MNILIQLGHPAHFHLYKNVIQHLKVDNHKVYVIIRKKDILEELLIEAKIPYKNILPQERKKNRIAYAFSMIQRLSKIFFFTLKYKIDLLTGSTPEVAQIGKLLNKHTVVTTEDDAEVIPALIKLIKPFVKTYLTPEVCNNGELEKKSIKYRSYHELAYLHPNQFSPDKTVIESYFSTETPYFLLRFAKLNAHHDGGIQGINTEIAQHLVDILEPHGNIYITSERELEPQFEKFRIQINPLDMHHIMAFSDLYIGDSQTMAAEAGVLGVPFVRFNDFVGRIGYLNELENIYHLGFGIKTNDIHQLYKTVNELIVMPDRKKVFFERRQKMLAEKIDLSKFLFWFLSNYPKSKAMMDQDSTIQYQFK